MKILLTSPLVFPINKDTKYAGIERLSYQYAVELSKEHQVSIIHHSQSEFPPQVTHLKAKPIGDPFIDSEVHAYQSYQYLMRKFDVIHDFSHSHLASRYMKLPSLIIFWHAPSLAQYPKAPYNIIALSQWAAREFKRIYHQEAHYQQSIIIDTEIYKPDPTIVRGNRLFALGVMTPEKGLLLAAQLCHQL